VKIPTGFFAGILVSELKKVVSPLTGKKYKENKIAIGKTRNGVIFWIVTRKD